MIIRVIDVETCGLPPGDAQIVEVATVDLVQMPAVSDDPSRHWARGRMWSSLVNPGRPIPPEASAVHHITDDMVKDAPRLSEVIAAVSAGTVVDGTSIVYAAHNMRFERECLSAHVDPEVTIILGLPWVCTYKCGVLLFPDAPSHKNQVLRYWLGLKLADPSLAQPHRALGDAYVTAALARTFLKHATVEQMIEGSSRPVHLPRLHFGEHAGKPITEVPTSYFDWIANKSKGPWDEDVLYTAKYELAERRTATRGRSPV